VVEKRDGWQGRAVERYSSSDQAVSIAANAKTSSHESSSRAGARLEVALWPAVQVSRVASPDYAAVVTFNSGA